MMCCFYVLSGQGACTRYFFCFKREKKEEKGEKIELFVLLLSGSWNLGCVCFDHFWFIWCLVVCLFVCLFVLDLARVGDYVK